MDRVRNIVCVLLFFAGLFDAARAQQLDSAVLKVPVKKVDPVVPSDTSFKKFLPAAIKLNAVNVLPFSVDYFIRRMSFANISWETIATNLRLNSWTWDGDRFLNNQFSHPYQGNLYFNAFRSERYSFWQSAAATFAGSLIWEVAAENEKPAINDLINTTLGGIAWGEMTHRLAIRFASNWRRGRKKKALDYLGMALDPMTAISTINNPRRRNALRLMTDTTPMRYELSAGSRQYNRTADGQRTETRGEWFTRMNFVYGDPAVQMRVPFSWFSVLLELGTSDSTLFNIARIRGNLVGWNVSEAHPNVHLLLLTLNYDYYNNTAFAYGMQSLQASLASRFRLLPKLDVQTDFGANLIGLAAVSDDELFKGKKRNYDYGNGFGVAATVNVSLRERLGLRTSYAFRWLHTLDGKNANYRVVNFVTALRGQVRKNIFLEYEWGHFLLKSLYTDRLHETKHNYYKRISAGYQFRF